MAGKKKRFTALGLVGILVAVLIVGVTAVALWPCSFPTPAAGALDSSQSSLAKTAPSGFVDATDGVKLAYYATIPANPVATLVFACCASAFSLMIRKCDWRSRFIATATIQSGTMVSISTNSSNSAFV